MRLLILVTLQTLTGWLGWLWLGWPGAALGAVAAALALGAVDALRVRRLIAWLRNPDLAAAPMRNGAWGEAGYSALRALRAERERARDSAQRLDDFLAAIQASPDGVILLDAQGRIEWCNAQASAHFGIDPRRDLMQPVGHLVREPAFHAWWAAGADEREVQLIGRLDTPARPVRLSAQAYPYGAGRRLMLSRDVTALAQADAMRRDFVANVSHEIRSPLTVLAGFIETMQSLPLTETERVHYLALMAAQSERMRELVDDLLTLSRLEGSLSPSATEPVDLRALLAQCDTEARALSHLLHPPEQRPQRLSFGDAPDFALTGSAHELHSAIANLVNNAVRYTPGGGAIEVRCTRLPDGCARIAVTDTGPGIAAEHLPRLGQRFYRVDRSRARESGGTGLGLAIAKHVAQRHGGELQIGSTLGKGSCFALVFPARRVVER
ncbi:MAG: phosphate regulon sensor histidine kinase PhoR [Burkholderiaceae bacterium]|jgi:two-component system phosphate regulon sensor histidine kinase PhoR|nr:phosphate regulon sensor histidine kinase PhoR [Burkholderiaceae bacterium]